MKLRCEQLVKKYGIRTVVKGVSMEINQGEIVGFLGPNGAGKTTSFYMITGQIVPNGGRVFLDDEDINRALKLGACGYIIKQDAAALPTSVRAVHKGQSVFGGKIVDRLPDLLNRTEKFDYAEYGITEKEQQLIELVADGLSNKEIADKMFLSEGTVRNLMSSVLAKLDLRDRTQLACFYYQKVKV